MVAAEYTSVAWIPGNKHLTYLFTNLLSEAVRGNVFRIGLTKSGRKLSYEIPQF